jgi:hypothetical protein
MAWARCLNSRPSRQSEAPHGQWPRHNSKEPQSEGSESERLATTGPEQAFKAMSLAGHSILSKATPLPLPVLLRWLLTQHAGFQAAGLIPVGRFDVIGYVVERPKFVILARCSIDWVRSRASAEFGA